MRADYDLIGQRSPLRLQLQAGGRWGPTPLPRARFAPYFSLGVLARQVWSRGWSQWIGPGFAGGTGYVPEQSRTLGEIIPVPGLGVRARIAERTFQLEYRPLYGHHSVTFGTTLPF